MTRYGRHHAHIGHHRARPGWQYTLLAVVGALAYLAGYLTGRRPEQENPTMLEHHPDDSGRPWLCPICYHRPCACPADGQRVTPRLVVVR